MKRLFCVAVIAVILIFGVGMNVMAAGTDEYVSQQLDAAGADELYDLLSQETKELFEQLGIYSVDYGQIMDVSPSQVFDLFLSLFKTKLQTPFGILGAILGIMLISSVIKSFASSLQEGKSAQIYGLVSAFAVGMTIIIPAAECISDAAAAIELSSNFMLLFIPIFVAVIISTGKAMTALSFNGLVFGLAQVITYVSQNFILPLTSGFLAFSLVGSFSSGIKIDSIIAFARKCITVVMGFMSTVFVALICMKGFISSAADTVGTKASKFLLSSFLPVVGSAMGEAMSTVRGCLSLVKGSLGAFGMAGILLIYVPVIIGLLSWQLMLFLGATVANMLELGVVSGVIRAISSTLTLLTSLLVFCTFLLVISIAVILMVKGG